MASRVRYTHSTSVFVIIRREREVLLLRRAATGWMDGFFSVPAGALEPGETIQRAAIREAREEVGVHLEISQIAYAHTIHCLTEAQGWVGHFFTATSWCGEARLREPDKHRDLLWCPADVLPDETIPYVRQAIECAGRGIRYSEFGWPS
jgi:8-oxo-dGTP diphosphatase